MRKFILKDTEKNTEMVFPVSPPSFELSNGINIETINLQTIGDINLPGYNTLSPIKIACMFPSKAYPFNQPGSSLDPYSYIKKIKKWSENHTVLRFVISDTTVNEQVIISDISYGERDGSGDVYANITAPRYRKLSVVQTQKTGNNSRGTDKVKTGNEKYLIKAGDTMNSICRKYYGDSSLGAKLASFNGIKNASIIRAGKTIKLPSKNLL